MKSQPEDSQKVGRTYYNLEPKIELQHEAQKLGAIGRFLGTRENASLYVAGAVLFVVLMLLGGIMYIDESMRADMATTLGAIGIAALGYICGNSSR